MIQILVLLLEIWSKVFCFQHSPTENFSQAQAKLDQRSFPKINHFTGVFWLRLEDIHSLACERGQCQLQLVTSRTHKLRHTHIHTHRHTATATTTQSVKGTTRGNKSKAAVEQHGTVPV